MYCSKCGKSYQADLKKCPYCNQQETKTASAREDFGNYRDRACLRVFQYKQADFALRMTATLIDLIILIIPVILLIVFTKVFGVIISVIIGWAYYALLESSSLQGTIGKFALKLEVTDLEGQPLNLLQATKRYFAHYLSILTLGAGYIILAFNDKKQAVHDLLTDCMVLDVVQQNKTANSQILEDN
ncbi:MAG: RDD family protein [Firmicutes bacterium]|nr:RDD family protein [Bacillota bacterium]